MSFTYTVPHFITMKITILQFSVLLALAILVISGCTTTPTTTTVNLGQNTRIFPSLKSMKALRDENVIKQAFDYSCGAASLATLLNFGLEDPTSEQEILLQLMESLPKNEEAVRKKEGFSLLDLKNVATMRGHKSHGFRIAPEYLAKLSGPVIVFIKPRGYEHFAVLKAVRGDRIYLADPSLGNVRMPAYKFLRMWLDQNNQGIIFIVERKDGKWPVKHGLQVKLKGIPQPEIMSAREMLEIGNPYLYIPRLFR